MKAAGRWTPAEHAAVEGTRTGPPALACNIQGGAGAGASPVAATSLAQSDRPCLQPGINRCHGSTWAARQGRRETCPRRRPAAPAHQTAVAYTADGGRSSPRSRRARPAGQGRDRQGRRHSPQHRNCTGSGQPRHGSYTHQGAASSCSRVGAAPRHSTAPSSRRGGITRRIASAAQTRTHHHQPARERDTVSRPCVSRREHTLSRPRLSAAQGSGVSRRGGGAGPQLQQLWVDPSLQAGLVLDRPQGEAHLQHLEVPGVARVLAQR